MFQTKVVENIKTHILCSVTFVRKSCRLWDNVEKYGSIGQVTDKNIIWRMRIACWITKATDTHSEFVILIAFPWQQWLRERASMLHLYAHCLFFFRLCPCSGIPKRTVCILKLANCLSSPEKAGKNLLHHSHQHLLLVHV
jgi:hypothetical protein